VPEVVGLPCSGVRFFTGVSPNPGDGRALRRTALIRPARDVRQPIAR
jgi:hypothetical protein